MGVGLRVALRVKPGSSRTRVGGDHDGALVIRVTTRAVDGKATEAALRTLADALGVRRSEITLVTGAASRTKLVDIAPAGRSDAQLAELASMITSLRT